MIKRIIKISTALLLCFILLTGCGGYDFSQTELTEAVGVKKGIIDELEIQPDDNGDTGNELIEQAKNMGGGFDFYTYWLPNGSSGEAYDVVGINFAAGKVSTVSLWTLGASRSQYTILGIHAGDSKSSALALAEEYFGESGSALSDDRSMWVLTDMERDMITFGNAGHKKGTLYIYVDVATETVTEIEFSKF